MKTNVFVKTKNVKGFVALMSELENLPLKIPKIALVTGDFGLGKSETIKWWSFKNDCIYVRANQGMSSRWLLSEIADELGEEYYWNSQATFNSIENHLLQEPKTIIIDMEHVRYAGENLTVSRLIVNQSSSTGAGGSLYNGFAPTTTLGCGSWGNNSISENLNYTHLINVSQIGLYNKDKKVPTDEEIWA